MKKVIISLVVLATTVATLIAVNSNDKLTECFESNVEALANWETESRFDPIWWVDYKDLVSMTCTLGGYCLCL